MWWSVWAQFMSHAKYSVNLPIFFSMIGGRSVPVSDLIQTIMTIKQAVCFFHQVSAVTLVLFNSLDGWNQIWWFTNLLRQVTLINFKRDWVVLQMGSNKGILRLSASISKVSAVMLKHVVMFVSRVWVAVGLGGILVGDWGMRHVSI
jgi:hypothetical protein